MALLSLTRDSEAVNAVVNHPAVRPFVGIPDGGPIDLTPLLARPEHIFPFGEHGGFALLWTAPHTREVHTFILPEGRGAWASEARMEGIRMAVEDGTTRLWTKIAPDAGNVRAFAVRGGMEPTGERIEEHGVVYDIYAMEAPCLSLAQ